VKQNKVDSIAAVAGILSVPGDCERSASRHDAGKTWLVDGRTSRVRATRNCDAGRRNGSEAGGEKGDSGKGRHCDVRLRRLEDYSGRSEAKCVESEKRVFMRSWNVY